MSYLWAVQFWLLFFFCFGGVFLSFLCFGMSFEKFMMNLHNFKKQMIKASFQKSKDRAEVRHFIFKRTDRSE